PVWGVLLGVWVLREPVTGSRLAGVGLGILGMLVLRGDELDLLQLGVDQDSNPRADQRFLSLHVDDPDRGRVQRDVVVGRAAAVERLGRARLGRRGPGGRAPAAAPGGVARARSARVASPEAASSRDSFGTPVRLRPVPDLRDSPHRELGRWLLTEKS